MGEIIPTKDLFDRYYFSDPSFIDGTLEFCALCREHTVPGTPLLEIGAGPRNRTTRILAETIRVVGVDVSPEVAQNPDLSAAAVYDGHRLPFDDESIDQCVSNYVLEHVADPGEHFREVARVLKTGGAYIVRTPNLMHYVSLASRVLPHTAHVRFAKQLRAQSAADHDPWVTYYRANTRRSLSRFARDAELVIRMFRTVEKEPSYARSSRLLFYPMMAYERVVNSNDLFGAMRSNILAVFAKPDAARRWADR